jgi:predicted DsbA family dithiol-disulfide isomerase
MRAGDEVKNFSIISFILCLALTYPSLAEVEWQTTQTLHLDRKPVDVVVSSRGSYIFILTDDGIIHVYDSTYNLKGKIDAGKNTESIACGPDENILILKNRKDKEIRTVLVEFIQEINIEGSPFMGRADAPVVMVVFTDYQCPYCERLKAVYEQLIENNKETLKIVIKNFPLSTHSFARKAAGMALAADAMGKFWEIQDRLYKDTKQMNNTLVREIATDLKLDPNEFESKINSKEIQNRISRDIMDAEKAGVRGTPTVFINGRIIKDRSIKGIQKIIDTQLEGKKK